MHTDIDSIPMSRSEEQRHLSNDNNDTYQYEDDDNGGLGDFKILDISVSARGLSTY